jgi:hypothetical protein
LSKSSHQPTSLTSTTRRTNHRHRIYTGAFSLSSPSAWITSATRTLTNIFTLANPPSLSSTAPDFQDIQHQVSNQIDQVSRHCTRAPNHPPSSFPIIHHKLPLSPYSRISHPAWLIRSHGSARTPSLPFGSGSVSSSTSSESYPISC